MSIQWYPGHMTKARRLIADAIPAQDLLIEVLDARMPAASANPVLAELGRDKPSLKILAKSDLADPAVTADWIRFLQTPGVWGARAPVIALATTTQRKGELQRRVLEGCKQLAPHRVGSIKKIRGLIVGIPNVGKSTLLNALVGRAVAKVGDEPAVTKAQQQVILPGGIVLHDNPGILWPNLGDGDTGMLLALGGAIPDRAIDYDSIALHGAALLLERYPDRLAARYKLDPLPADATALLEAIGRKRGCIRAGGVIDRHKAADILIHELRSGVLGGITLQRPSDLHFAFLDDDAAAPTDEAHETGPDAGEGDSDRDDPGEDGDPRVD